MTVVHPIGRAQVTNGGTGAPNYDEFADEAEITEIIAANPRSALAVEMPHRAPESLGATFTEALPAAAARLEKALAERWYRPVEDVVVLYRISGPDSVAYGLFCLADTDQISTRADEPGLVIRNEDVFIEKVRERVALAGATGHLLSAVLLLQTARGRELHRALVAACGAAGAPVATEVDKAGRTHEIWPILPGEVATKLCALAGDGELVVADGNHRSLAAQLGELPRFLAVVTTPESVQIAPYHRLVTELGRPMDDLVEQLKAAGARVTPLVDSAGLEGRHRQPTPGTSGHPGVPDQSGVVHLYGGGAGYTVEFAAPPGASVVDRLDHALVERMLLDTVLGLDPGDKRITYVGGDYPARWLCDEVDSRRSELAILIPPVRIEDFIAVNLARQKMPRKSTWFTPKASAGLVLAQLT